MKNWRFRTGFFGRLILQRLTFPLDGCPSGQWRDATSEDLLDFYREMLAAAPRIDKDC